MSYDQKYTYLDGAWHAIGWSEHTQCGLVIPMGNGYVTGLPDKAKAHCGPDTKTAETEAKKPDPVAASAKADEVNAAAAAPDLTEAQPYTGKTKTTAAVPKGKTSGGKVA